MKKMKLQMKTQMKNKWKNNNFKHFQSVARCESYNFNLPDLAQPAKSGIQAQQRKLAPDLVTIGIGVSACGKGEQWTKSLQLLEFAKLQKVEPTPTVLNSVLDGMDRALCWTQSLAMLTLFEQERLHLDSLSFRSIMQASEASSNHLQSLGCRCFMIFHRGQEEYKNVPFVFDLVLFTPGFAFTVNLLLPKDARLHRWHRALDWNKGCPDLLSAE